MASIVDKKYKKATGKIEFSEEKYAKVRVDYAAVETDYAVYIRDLARIKEIDDRIAALNAEKSGNIATINTNTARIKEIDARLKGITTIFTKIPATPSFLELVTRDNLQKEVNTLDVEITTLSNSISALTKRNTDIDAEILSLTTERDAKVTEANNLKLKHDFD